MFVKVCGNWGCLRLYRWAELIALCRFLRLLLKFFIFNNFRFISFTFFTSSCKLFNPGYDKIVLSLHTNEAIYKYGNQNRSTNATSYKEPKGLGFCNFCLLQCLGIQHQICVSFLLSHLVNYLVRVSVLILVADCEVTAASRVVSHD